MSTASGTGLRVHSQRTRDGPSAPAILACFSKEGAGFEIIEDVYAPARFMRNMASDADTAAP
jgi:hypothetical protein